MNTAPSAIFIAAQSYFVGKITSVKEAAQLDLTYVILNVFMYLNSAINFFLYVLSGPRFRADVKALFVCGKRCATKDETSSAKNQTNLEIHNENLI